MATLNAREKAQASARKHASVAALYIRADGPYPTRALECYDVHRDARNYEGPYPVVAHPPCERWGRYWWADGSAEPGNDGGLFRHALDCVRQFGGVLEHPEGTHAWRAFDIPKPVLGCWSACLLGGWTTCVPQRNYGHRAQKMTWLYYVGSAAPPVLDWSAPASPEAYLSQPGRCKRGKPRRRCPCERCRLYFGDAWEGREPFERMTAAENELTPEPFADLLISLALQSGGPTP